HTSLVQGMMAPMTMHWSRAETPSPVMALGMPKGTPAALFECGDGVWVHIMRPPDSPLMDKVLEELGDAALQDDEPSPWTFGSDRTLAAFLRRPSQDWLENFWANDIPAQPALRPGEIFSDEQARINSYVVELDDDEVGRITMAGMPLTVNPPTRIRGSAPALAAHTDEVLAEWKLTTEKRAEAKRADVRRTTSSTPQRWPLEGVHVLDLGNFLAGPYGPQLLADLGADVVKLESTSGDQMRMTEWAFAGCQRGKRSVALDLKAPDARAALGRLVEWADVVHHNVRMPAARRLGIDDETLREINPDIVYCHASSYGPIGPRADWPGFDQLFQSSCGWEVAGAGEGNPPMWHRFGFMDHLCALSSLVATLLALYHRDRTGHGQQVAGSLLGGGVLTNSETYVGPDGVLAPFATLDARQVRVEPGYEIVDVRDGWIAIAARTDEQRGALHAATGVEDLADAADVLRSHTVSDALRLLDRAGVPSEEVRRDQKLAFFDDPVNREAGLVAQYPHAEWGVLEQPGSSWYFGDLETRFDHAPPVLGEHTVEILTEMGLAPEEIQALLDSGTAKAYAP
ncbi:MAG: CoA transferase, partial [Acidimicrobiia bacterium]